MQKKKIYLVFTRQKQNCLRSHLLILILREGTATELLKQLPDMQLSANVLSRRLNVVNSQLLNDYGIFYDNRRGHERRMWRIYDRLRSRWSDKKCGA